MAFAVNIDIERKLPVINGYVSIPDGQILSPTSLTPSDVIALIPGTRIMKLATGGAGFVTTTLSSVGTEETLRNMKEQFWMVLPTYDRLNISPADWFQILRDAAGNVGV